MGKRTTKRKPVSDQLKAIIDGCGLSRYAVGIGTGVDHAALSRFMRGERGLNTKAIDKLGAFFDLEVVAHARRRS